MRSALLAAAGAAALLLPGAPAASADTLPPLLVSLTVSATDVDATNGPVRITLDARVRDADGLQYVNLGADHVPDPAAHPLTRTEQLRPRAEDVRLVSGTATDGVWRGTFVVAGGTWGRWNLVFSALDNANNVVVLESAQLAAQGKPSVVTSRTTAVPKAPTSLRGRTEYRWVGFVLRTFGELTWTNPAGPAVRTATVGSASAGCGTPQGATATTQTLVDRNAFVPCTVSVRTVNARGVSPATSVTFW